MRVIPWSVELLPGTPGHWSLAHTHSFHQHTHTFKLPSQLHNTTNHRRPPAILLRNRPWRALTCSTAAIENTSSNGYERVFRRYVHQSTPHGNASTHTDLYRTGLDSLLAALRQCDTFKLYLCLLDFTRGASLNNQAFCHVVQTIPPTTFSEILRNFDPFHISKYVDSAPGISISWGAAIHSPLGDLINKWGVKVLYVRILNRLRLLQRARQLPRSDGSPSQIRPLLRDYLVLLRCAGATSDIRLAKVIWWELISDGYGDWRHAELYAEFIKSRYLTEALYANNDLSRFRLRPLDLHRSVVILKKDVVRKLGRLNATLTDRHSHRFGQNVNEYYFAEPLTRLLRKRKPLKRLERRAIIRRMIPGDELLLCAFLKANGRHGRVHASNVLMRFWGINISNFKRELGNWEVSGGHDFPSGSALAPTEALLDAVVHCYGNMGEVPLAKALVDFISRRWGIAVPDKVWSDLLGFARIYSTDPAEREWRLAQFQNKLITPEMVLDIWNFAVQAPHTFQPSMRDYYSLVKSMIGPQRPLDQFLDAIRQLTPLYKRTARQLQGAWTELILTTQQGVSNHAAYRHYRVLQSSKHYMWYSFHYTALQVLKKLSPLRVDCADATRHIPDLVAELKPFLRISIRYRIATGIVDLHVDSKQLRAMEAEQTLHTPNPLSLRPKHQYWATETARGIESANVDWTTFENLPNGAALRDYLAMTGTKQGEDVQLGRDEPDVEEEEEEDAGQENIYVRHEGETQLKMDKSIKMQAARDPDESRDRESTNKRLDIGTLSLERHAQDAFDESRNSSYKPPPVDRLEADPMRECALFEDPFAETFHSRFQESVAISTATQYCKDWDRHTTPEALTYTNRQSKAQQLVERPASMWRPRYSAPPGEPSLSTLREDGKEFTGFHDDPLKAHFAAHRIIREMVHRPGVPIGLGRPGVPITKRQVMENMLDART
ncbi:hypothetical protein N0V82_002923 [Gnomoniopsis sp. IMI 355080]|nr:hypothetical protein N0V82_002923 [Gnomoniopsis sp. IMI 355080]